MTAFLTLVQVYIVGGLTFIPLILLGIFIHGYLTFPYVPDTGHDQFDDDLRDVADDGKNIVSGTSGTTEKLRKDQDKGVAEGYFAVCREYVPGGVNGKPPIRTTPAGQVIAQESPSVYQNMYRSLFERRQASTLDPSKADGSKSIKRARNIFYVVLRHGHLMLYDDSEQVEVRHVISVAHHDISIFDGGHEIPEGELWIKRNAICLKRRASTLDKGASTLPFFFFSENCTEKEDFYFALLQSQNKTNHDGLSSPQAQDFEVKDIISLVQRLHSSEEHLQTRWLNALIGRVFLALYKTQLAENFIRAKIIKKISRVQKPAILSGIVLQSINMGHAGPLITNPKLRDLTVDGEYGAEAHVSYEGGFRLEIGTTARIDLGQRFKAREYSLILAVVVKKLEGKLLVRLKPPPSNRFWISFETMPQLELSVEPVVSSRQITYGVVLRAIEHRIREVIAETIVLPNWDDLPFYETLDQAFRGGIWQHGDDGSKKEMETEIPDDTVEDEETSTSELSGLKDSDERTQSAPSLPDTVERGIHGRGHRVAGSTASVDEASMATGFQKAAEKPKVLRTTSFALVADPVINTDSVNGDASKEPAKKGKSLKDAASYISEISSRSQPTSPFMDVMDDKLSISQSSAHSHDTSSLDGASVRDLKSQPVNVQNNKQQQTKLQGLVKTLTPSDKKQQTALAAAAAAKNWGWNTFAKKQKSISDERAGTPDNPLGRGRPLPPPGMPLPGPDSKRASVLSLGLPKRKPVPTVSKENDNDKAQFPPPSREHRRGSFQSKTDQMLVIEAPEESGPPSLTDDYGDFMDNVKSDEEESQLHESPTQAYNKIEKDTPQSPSRRTISSQLSSSYEDDDAHGLASWKIAQEEEARQRNLWMNEHEHEQ